MKKVENYCSKGYAYSILRTTDLCNKIFCDHTLTFGRVVPW